MCLGWNKLDKNTIRQIVLKFKQSRYYAGHDILKFKQISHKSYYIFSGTVSVYIVNPATDEKYHFQKLKEGSSFNMITSIFNNYWIFQFTADVEWIIYELDFDDLDANVRKFTDLKTVYDKIKTKHKIDSLKYDFWYNNEPPPKKEEEVKEDIVQETKDKTKSKPPLPGRVKKHKTVFNLNLNFRPDLATLANVGKFSPFHSL